MSPLFAREVDHSMNVQSTRFWAWAVVLFLVLLLGVVLLVPGILDGQLNLFRGARSDSNNQGYQSKSLDEWIGQLDSAKVDDQASACLAFQYFPMEKAAAAIPKLIPLLQSKSLQVRVGAANALGHLGPAARGAIPSLLILLPDQDVQVAEALSRLCSPEDQAAVVPLHAALKESPKEGPRELPLYLTQALGKIGPAAQPAVPTLTDLLKAKDEYVRAAASEALGLIGPKAGSATPALTAALEDQVGGVGVAAALALWRIDQSPKAIPALVDFLKSKENQYVRISAAQALGQIGPPAAKTAGPILLDIAQNDTMRGVNGRYEVRTAAKTALAKIDPEAAAQIK